MSALPPVFLLGLGVIAISVISQLGFGEGRWIGGNLAPKGSRINPLSGLKRMFGPTGWIEMAKRSEEHTSELQSLMRSSYAVFCLKKKSDKYRTSEYPSI